MNSNNLFTSQIESNNINNNNESNTIIQYNNKLNSNNIFIKKIIKCPFQLSIKKSKKYEINLEELLILEEKLNYLIQIIMKDNINFNLISKSCYDYWNYYYNCSIKGNLDDYFLDEYSHNIINTYIKYKLFSLIIIYDTSFNKDLFYKIYLKLNNLLIFIYQSFLIICDYILNKVYINNKNFWVEKLEFILNDNFNIDERKLSYINRISNNNNNINNILINFINNNTIYQNDIIQLYYSILNDNNYKITLNEFFINKICICQNINGSLISTSFLNNNTYKKQSIINTPFILNNTIKKFSLILDLDETIISFKISENDDTNACLRIRPGLDDFINNIKNLYEIIIFTAGTKEYADPILDAIEDNHKIFDYRLYREHTTIINNDFVKDISKIGRPISSMVIVDNIPQNFILQKDNGILISSFWGEDEHDVALFELKNILINIYNQFDDIRDGLKYYKDIITQKVSMSKI